MVGDLVVREARPSEARAIAEVSVASQRRSYRDLIAKADLAELTGRVVGYAYVLPSPDADVPVETSELGSLYVTEEVAGTEVAPALMDAAVEHSRPPDTRSSRSGCAERTAGLVASTRSTACGKTVQSAAVPTTSCRPR